jgi:cyclic dehypoxanthinyl futalosine synthase
MTGLPFVYAVWAGHPQRVTPAVVAALISARDRGLTELERIARASAVDDRTRARHLDYLHQAIRYHLGPRELDGLQRYFELAAAHGLIPAVPELRLFAQVEVERA